MNVINDVICVRQKKNVTTINEIKSNKLFNILSKVLLEILFSYFWKSLVFYLSNYIQAKPVASLHFETVSDL